MTQGGFTRKSIANPMQIPGSGVCVCMCVWEELSIRCLHMCRLFSDISQSLNSATKPIGHATSFFEKGAVLGCEGDL